LRSAALPISPVLDSAVCAAAELAANASTVAREMTRVNASTPFADGGARRR